jgi:hypothetical protein
MLTLPGPLLISFAALSRAGIINYDFALAAAKNTAYGKDAAVFERIITEAVAAIQRVVQ